MRYLGTEGSPSALDSIVEGTSPNDFQTQLVGSHSTFYSSTSSYSDASSTLGDADTVCSLPDNSPELITVRIWIEGWDAEATNALMGAVLSVSFQFVIKEA